MKLLKTHSRLRSLLAILTMFLLFLGPSGLDLTQASTPAPPVVTTGGTFNITATSAFVAGTLTDKGSATAVTVGFEFGLSPTYNITVPGEPPSLTGPGTFTARLTGLSPNTLYHYRAEAGGDGSGYGNDLVFTTAPAPVPPTLVTIAATSVSSNGAVLHGNVSDKGSTNSSVQVSFDYGPNISYGNSVKSFLQYSPTQRPFSCLIMGLTSNTL
jgi:hypothetical protein